MSRKAIRKYQYNTTTATVSTTTITTTTTTTTNMFVRLMNNSTSDTFLYESVCQQLTDYKRQSGQNCPLYRLNLRVFTKYHKMDPLRL